MNPESSELTTMRARASVAESYARATVEFLRAFLDTHDPLEDYDEFEPLRRHVNTAPNFGWDAGNGCHSNSMAARHGLDVVAPEDVYDPTFLELGPVRLTLDGKPIEEDN